MPPIIVTCHTSRAGVPPRRLLELPPAGGIIVVPSPQIFAGDSQTGGRAFDTPTALNHQTAYLNIWADSGFTAPSSVWDDGVGGRSLTGTFNAITAEGFTGARTFHIQESGDQNLAGQRSASEFATTLKNGIIALHTSCPGSVFIYETAFSFGREATTWRDWHPYNDVLEGVKSDLFGLGIIMIISPVCEVIELLETVLPPADVWYQTGHAQAYHFTGVGNFAVAMARFGALNYNLSALSHGSVLLDSDDKQAAILAVQEVIG